MSDKAEKLMRQADTDASTIQDLQRQLDQLAEERDALADQAGEFTRLEKQAKSAIEKWERLSKQNRALLDQLEQHKDKVASVDQIQAQHEELRKELEDRIQELTSQAIQSEALTQEHAKEGEQWERER
ncbi:hypothetical protein BZG36_02463 [Bifiguratus adelaidae]|uniref:Uncharacterized protein n=1 Tax=Bifiguratus adelaidae TaxID=1938954 RepID=A0A261Y3L4_9FUNG|nr:hypothetical protein BZG36_02463 [Bifiguratus adelaidae]